jgi:hypothetical protein
MLKYTSSLLKLPQRFAAKRSVQFQSAKLFANIKIPKKYNYTDIHKTYKASRIKVRAQTNTIIALLLLAVSDNSISSRF